MAVAGEIAIRREDDETKARIFYVAYNLEGARQEGRPITFAFNGGPGAASVWLHLGGLGPQRVRLRDDGEAPPPPARYEANPDTWLGFTDMVFVDPVGTGFSRSEPDDQESPGDYGAVA